MTPNWRIWTVRADRRDADLERLRAELLELDQTLEGLRVTLVDPQQVEDAPDGGAFRDFLPVAQASARSEQVLEVMAEELLLEFGFLVDFLKQG
jgi:hypothetical protein